MENICRIDAGGIYYKILNKRIRELIANGERNIELLNVNGQRYIAGGITEKVRINIHGTPGNDLGSFMDGPQIIVNNNAQDGVGNTMNGGKIIVKGMAGDVCGYGMRGGKLFILGDAGYRVGIHMKGYKHLNPVIIIGGNTGDFLAEYMAGGVIILLRIFGRRSADGIRSDYIGTGMHGGTVYVRGEVDKNRLGNGVGIVDMDDSDRALLEENIKEYAMDFNLNEREILSERFTKLKPLSTRPYGRLYTY